jgi:putative ABC transport system substrate-binding protein
VKRREFITLLGGAAAAWPITARAQQPTMPVIGFLDARSPDAMADRLRGFRQGLRDAGFVEGDNATILYRWAENALDRVPEMAAELVRRHVAVIVASGGIAVSLAAKAATTAVPIVFIVSEDPVRHGLVASLARPGGNLTGINFFNNELTAKRLGSCMSWCLAPAAWPSFLIRPMPPPGRPRCGTWNRRPAPSGCKFRSCVPAPVRRSMRRRQHSYANRPTPCSSATTPSSTAGASNWSNWRRTIGCPRSFQGENIPKWAG